MEPAARDPAEAPLFLEFGEEAIRLLRPAEGGLEPLGAVPLDDPDFAAAAAALGASAAALTGLSPAPVTLWLPPARVLAVVAEGDGAAAERAVEAASPAPLAELVVTLAAQGGVAAAAERSVVEEAAEYARLWGFAPLRISTNPAARPELAAFPDGPDFLPAPPAPTTEPTAPAAPAPSVAAAPASAPSGRLRIRGAALLAGLVGLAAAAAIWLAPQGRDEAPFTAAPPPPAALLAPVVVVQAAAPAILSPAPTAPTPDGVPEPARGAAPPAFVAVTEPPEAPVMPETPPPPAAVSPAPEAAAPPPAPAAPAAPAPAAEEPPAPEPPAEAALAAAGEAAPETAEAAEEPPGPGAVERAPRPGARPDHLDMTPSDRALALAPQPRARPKGLAPRREPAAQPRAGTARAAPSGPIDDEEGEEAGIAEAPRRSAPTGAGVAAAATLQDAIRLDDMAMIGVFGAADARRALLRMPDGRVHRVTSGSVVDGWVVSRIEAGSMRLTRGGEARTLDLTQ